MRRYALTLVACVLSTACGDAPTQVSDYTPSFSASERAAGPSASASGSGQTSGAERIFTFSGIEHADGTVSGSFQLLITESIGGSLNPSVLSITADVVCIEVVANRAWLGGVVTASSNPDFVGRETGFAVRDDGAGPDSGDLISQILIPAATPGTAQAVCDREIPRVPNLPIESGNVRVEFLEFVEDFSSFADGEVPTSPSPTYLYVQNDALEGVTVRVAEASGALADRPLVLSKASSATVGAPNFAVRDVFYRPLLEVSGGRVLISTDVQVEGGSFCSFFTIRGPTAAAAAVYLHDLDFTLGVPFHLEVALDVAAGTASATMDGVAIPLTVADGGTVTGEVVPFPYMPHQFGFEGCTTNAQAASVDNLRLGWGSR